MDNRQRVRDDHRRRLPQVPEDRKQKKISEQGKNTGNRTKVRVSQNPEPLRGEKTNNSRACEIGIKISWTSND